MISYSRVSTERWWFEANGRVHGMYIRLVGASCSELGKVEWAAAMARIEGQIHRRREAARQSSMLAD